MEAKRAKTARGRRILGRRDPKLQENPRTALIVRGQKTSAVVNELLTDLFALKKPYAVHFKRHNAVHPFEDITPLEFLAQRNDASLFAFGSHSKKRPHNLVLGRMFDQHLLDMFELAIKEVKPMSTFAGSAQGGASNETKPCLLFQGDWANSPNLSALRLLLLDFFNQRAVEAISNIGIERVIAFTAVPPSDASDVDAKATVLMRHYVCTLKKSAEATGPFTELSEIGPSLDLRVGRVQTPSTDLMRLANTQAPASGTSLKPKKTKNITHSALNGRQGRLHIQKQDLTQMATARMKGLTKPRQKKQHAKITPKEEE